MRSQIDGETRGPDEGRDPWTRLRARSVDQIEGEECCEYLWRQKLNISMSRPRILVKNSSGENLSLGDLPSRCSAGACDAQLSPFAPTAVKME